MHVAVNFGRLFPIFSIMSISPQVGQSTVPISFPASKSRPHSLPLRNLYAGLEASILLLKQTHRLEPRGGVLASDSVGPSEGLLDGGDDQIAVLHVRVLRSMV